MPCKLCSAQSCPSQCQNVWVAETADYIYMQQAQLFSLALRQKIYKIIPIYIEVGGGEDIADMIECVRSHFFIDKASPSHPIRERRRGKDL